jgi:hypothetical protein
VWWSKPALSNGMEMFIAVDRKEHKKSRNFERVLRGRRWLLSSFLSYTWDLNLMRYDSLIDWLIDILFKHTTLLHSLAFRLRVLHQH